MRRRRFMLGLVGAGGALVLGWTLLPPRQRLQGGVAGPGRFGGWLEITPADRVRVVVPKSEMGQGVHTALAMVLADELDADWDTVEVAPAPVDGLYRNLALGTDGLPFHPDDHGVVARAAGWLTAKAMREIGVMATGGSTSVKDLWAPLREAGATARAMLVQAAAAAWGVPAGEVTAAAGTLRHAGSGRSARFGALAQAAAARPLPGAVTLKTSAQFTRIGRATPRLDSAAKSRGAGPGQGLAGAPGFGIDAAAALPAEAGPLLHAAVQMGPVPGSTVAGFDAAPAQGPGVRAAFGIGAHHGGTAGVAVVADTAWRALRAAPRVAVRWDEPAGAAALSDESVTQRLRAALDDTGPDGTRGSWSLLKRGDPEAALAGAARRVEAEYRAPYLGHATLEPQNATVLIDETAEGGPRAQVWAPTQVPDLARRAVARVLGLAEERVALHVTWLGGGFGRRLEVDFVAQAADIAREAARRGLGRGGRTAVHTLWSRQEDATHDFLRPAAVARMAAGLDAQGRLVAWRHLVASQAVLPQVLQRLWGLPFAGPDKTALEGAFDQPYEFAAARAAHRPVELPVPVGFWRSVGHSHNAFFKDAVLDEVAHAAGADPLAFRLALLQRHPRHAAVLRRVAERAGWGTPLPPAPDGAPRARGLALHESFGSVVAQVVEASVGPAGSATPAVRVHRVVCTIDCGTVVNPDGVRQQMEGAVVFALSAALHGGVRLQAGRIQGRQLDDPPLLRLAQCPDIEVELMASDAPPQGVGEPGVPPLAPALANALFALTGVRQRSLPLRAAS